MLVGLVSQKSWVKAEAARRFLAEKQRELAGPNASVLELTIARQLALAFYELDHLNHLSVGVSRFMGNEAARLIDRRRDRAHARAMSAAKTLGTVRRLLSGKPVLAMGVQVNVSNQRAGSESIERSGSEPSAARTVGASTLAPLSHDNALK